MDFQKKTQISEKCFLNCLPKTYKLNTDRSDDPNSRNDLKNSINARNKIKILKEKKKRTKKIKYPQSVLAEKEKLKLNKDIKKLFKSSQFSNQNLKSLQKELKINDTIVAVISSIIILLSFIQVNKKFLLKKRFMIL